MEQATFLVGWIVLVCAGIAAAGCALLGACALFRYATREARANVDLWRAIGEWKRNHPEAAKRYADDD